MKDIALSKTGDISIVKTEKGSFDVLIDDDPIGNLIRRAIRTPLRYIGRYVVDKNGLNKVDRDFGDAVYKELSEGMTINFVARVRQHIENAVRQVEADVNVTNIELTVEEESVEVFVYFDDLTTARVNIPVNKLN